MVFDIRLNNLYSVNLCKALTLVNLKNLFKCLSVDQRDVLLALNLTPAHESEFGETYNFHLENADGRNE